ncbi:membrane protein [Microbacterium phage BabyDotz]|nr:membrane protein [Microbacterium phage Grassboy]WNT45324.1 membrane protein [Microbacterium phage BabyDotz]
MAPRRDEITLRGALIRLGVMLIGCLAIWTTQQWELGWMGGLPLLGIAFGILDTVSGNEG